MMFKGVYTAIVTPFEDGAIDVASLTRLVESQVDAGIHGIVACGTTGESATLSDDEIVEITRLVVEVSAGACQVISGVGSNSTHRTCELLRRVSGLGIDGALVITPYYNKPSQQGLTAHFEAVSKASPQTPLMLYTVPGRTGVELSVETFQKVSTLDNVFALKDAAADLALSAEYIQAANGRANVLSGDDVTALPMWSVGGQGLVSVAANLCPDLMVGMWHAYENGDVVGARALHARLLPLFRALFVESNPLPVKYLMAQMKLIQTGAMRLPLVPVTAESARFLDRRMSELNLGGDSIHE
jgi:4-hydroxy-tetrahydrodipicolinate synthase